MPLHQGTDKDGKYWQWGDQTKYHYKTVRGEKQARTKAGKQGMAIGWSKHQGGLVMPFKMVGGPDSLPPWSKQGISYQEWRKKMGY